MMGEGKLTSFVLPQSLSSVILEARYAVLGAPQSGEVHPRTWKQASRVVEFMAPLEKVQLVDRYGPPRSIYCIHKQAFAVCPDFY